MPVHYDKAKSRWRWQSSSSLGNLRVSKLLPRGIKEAEAKAIGDKLEARKAVEVYGLEGAHTIEKALMQYLGEQQKAKGYRELVSHIHRLAPYVAGRTIEECAEVAKEYTAAARAEGLSDTTVHVRLSYLRAALNRYCKGNKLPSPAHWMDIPAPEKGPTLALTRKQMLAVARKLKGKVRAFVLVAFYSGMRAGEIMRCTVEGDEFVVRGTKNGDAEARTPVHPKLAPYLRHIPFPGTYRASYYKPYERVVGSLGLEGVTMHTLRHSTASAIISNGGSLADVGAVLRHKSAASVMRYAHMHTEAKRKALGRIK